MATQVTLNSGSVDSAGSLALKTNGTTTAVTINASQGVEFNAGAVGTPSITTTGDTNTGIFFPAADTIGFAEGGVEAMRLDSAGNMGLGVTPSALTSGYKGFEINNVGNALTSTQNVVNLSTNAIRGTTFTYGATSPATLYQQSSGTHVWYTAASGTAGNTISFTQVMTLDASGNLIVGGTTAYGKTTVSGTLPFLRVVDTAGSSGVWGSYISGSSTDLAGFTYSSVTGENRIGGLQSYVFPTFYSGGSESARIDTSGNVLVGAISTFGTGPVQIQSATSGQLSLRNSAASAGAHWRMGPDSSANDLILYSSNASGGVYIGNASTSWSGRSDERLKDIIEPITDAANKVSNLRAVIGKFKTDEEGTRRSFLIAQDVQAVLPEAVSVSPRKEGEDTDYLGVAYTDVIPLLVAAIKEQQAIITQLQADVAALKGTA
jgi:hypothetical protein